MVRAVCRCGAASAPAEADVAKAGPAVPAAGWLVAEELRRWDGKPRSYRLTCPDGHPEPECRLESAGPSPAK